MRIALLTTDNPPAAQYAKTIAGAFDLCGIVVREQLPALPFETAHELDGQQTDIETQTWFGGKLPPLSDFAPVTAVPDMISGEATEAVKALNPDVLVAAGAGALSDDVINTAGAQAIALHAGDPEDYRGEDTHLWSVYHGDVARLKAIVQYADADVNAGAVLLNTPPVLPPDLPLAALRMAVVDVCAVGALKTLGFFDSGGMLTVNHLQRMGKVYTAMPSVVKGYCIEQFARRADAAG